MERFGLLVACALLTGCVHASVMQLNADTAEVTVSGAPVCGDTGTQQIAYEDAAITTLKAGFDGFVILGTGEGDTLAGVAVAPSTASTVTNGNFDATSTGGFTTGNLETTSSTTVSGGSALPFFRHKDEIVIRMFHAADPAYTQAVPARGVLGPTWAQKLSGGMPVTCTS
jgi:hypothetical protein